MVVYTTYRSKAVVAMLVLFWVAMWLTLQGALCLVLLCICLCFSSVHFSRVITLLGEEGAGLCASRASVC